MNKKIASVSNYLAGIIMLAFGSVYFLRNSFMPYHSDAVALDWASVDAGMQTLILALMRVAAGGYLALGIAVMMLQYRFSKSKLPWIPLVILIAGLIESLASMYATMLVRLYSPGKPPTAMAIVGILLILLGYIFNRRALKES